MDDLLRQVSLYMNVSKFKIIIKPPELMKKEISEVNQKITDF